MEQKPEADYCQPPPLKRHKASSSQTTPEITPDFASDRDYDVFLNFRGPDSRHTVTDVLYRGLTNAWFLVFLDDEEIRKGEVIKGELLGAITNSRIYIPIFSKDYASSKWCLRELAKMIDCWEASSGNTKKVILPIFYDVDVSKDLKLRSQVYTAALRKHKDELGEVTVKPWEDALLKVATIKGWNLKDHGLSELADLINKEVFSKLIASEAVPSLLDHLVGIDKPVEDIMELLEEGSPDVRFIVIHGMGGIGKTTLADAVFKKISCRFQGRCFLKDLRQSVSDDDMVKLQEKLLLDTLNLKTIKVTDIRDGIGMISKRLRYKNVLTVLDDVDKRDHILNLAAKSFWFGPKSRIIITTRNIKFLPTKEDKEYYFYEMKEMGSRHALQLFCWHAFEKDRPPLEFSDISTKIVATTGGLPLSLKVIGSSLYNEDDGTWKFRLEKLKDAPHKDVRETLMVSYQSLEYEQQQIFLDIACLFDGEKKTYPFYFWEACKLYPEVGIKILVRRSLIKECHDDFLWMHNQMRDFGRAISQPKMPCLESQFPTRPSRLWSPDYALDALQRQEVAQSVIAIKLGRLDANCRFVAEEFARAKSLKFLTLQGGNFDGDFKNVFHQLIWLSWFDCPLRLEVKNLSFKNLVILKLARCLIDEDWGGWGVFKESIHLKVLHLEDYKRLKRTPTFSTWMRLESLVLRDCSGLEEIDISINKLKHLNCLEISNGNNGFSQFVLPVPSRPQLIQGSIGDLESLQVLKINNAGLQELHPSIGELLHLKILDLRKCLFLKTLRGSIEKLQLLVKLDSSHSGIEELPDSIGELKCLNILRMEHCPIKYLPDTIGRLKSLEELNLDHSDIILLPETIGNLERLKDINVSHTNIKMLPETLVKLENLESLWSDHCKKMVGNLPEEIGKLSCLRFLCLVDTATRRVPTTINQLSHLQQLNLYGIHEPQELLNLPTSLTSLNVSSSSLEPRLVPDLSHLTNLVGLSLYNESNDDSPPCNQTPHMKWLARLTKLEDLTLDLPNLVLPSTDLSSLPRLQSLEMTCVDLQSLPQLPSSLDRLGLINVKSPIDWQHLSSLNNLSTLSIYKYSSKEIKFDCLEHLHHLFLHQCEFLERVSNLSCLRELQVLTISQCPLVVDIEGLGELKSLWSLGLWECASIQRLSDLSMLEKLEELRLWDCDTLESIPDVDEKEVQCYLYISNCKHFCDFYGPYSERHLAIKHECSEEGSHFEGSSMSP